MAELKGGSTVAGSLILTKANYSSSLAGGAINSYLVLGSGTYVNSDTVTDASLAIPYNSYIYGINVNGNLRKLIGLNGPTSADIEIGAGGTSLISSINLKAGSAGYISLTPGGGEALRVISNGNVGIGTTGPSEKLNVSGNILATGTISGSNLSGTNTGDQTTITGNAGTATTLQTARTIALSGAATGTATSFNGSANITISVTSLNAANLSGTVPNASISGSYTGMSSLTGSGTVDFAKFLGNAADTVSAPSFSWTGDTNTGIYAPAADQVAITTGGVQRALFSSAGVTATTFNGALNGNASTATSAATLTTARTIAGVSFNGSANISIPYANLTSIPSTFAPSSHALNSHSSCTLAQLTALVSDATLVSSTGTNATGSWGISITGSSASCTGNAATASSAATLTTARTIAGTSFNGSANINISYPNLTNKPSFYTSNTYAISGEIKVPSGSVDYIVPFYVPVKSGTTVKLIAVRHSIQSGTSATVKLTKNGTDITGFTSMSVTTTDTSTDPTDVTLADNDEIALVVTAVSGTPKHLTVTLIYEVFL